MIGNSKSGLLDLYLVGLQHLQIFSCYCACILFQYKKLRQKPYFGNQFWAKGYYVDTVVTDREMIRKT